MNHVYRLVWNECNRAWVAVAETVKGRGKRNGGTVGHPPRLVRAASLPKLQMLAASLALIGAPAYALDINSLPTGGRVTAGLATISQSANALTVQQSSARGTRLAELQHRFSRQRQLQAAR